MIGILIVGSCLLLQIFNFYLYLGMVIVMVMVMTLEKKALISAVVQCTAKVQW